MKALRPLYFIPIAWFLASCAAPPSSTDGEDTQWSARGERGVLEFTLSSDDTLFEGKHDFELMLTGDTADAVTVVARAVMPSMTHGEIPIEVAIDDLGVHHLVDVDLSMVGEWSVVLEAGRGGEVVDWTTIVVDVR